KFAENYTKRELMAILNPQGTPCGPRMAIGYLVVHVAAHGLDRGLVLNGPQRGQRMTAGVPIQLYDEPARAEASPRLAARTRKVHQFKSLKAPEAVQAMKTANADIGIMAFVLQFAPQDFVRLPRHGTIQYHPSLLPKYRGPSSINWPISRGEKETGLTIFRPTDGLDEGAVVLQKKTPVGENDTLGTVYFDRLFPMGVQAMLEAAD